MTLKPRGSEQKYRPNYLFTRSRNKLCTHKPKSTLYTFLFCFEICISLLIDTVIYDISEGCMYALYFLLHISYILYYLSHSLLKYSSQVICIFLCIRTIEWRSQ